jgi:23S rRNA (cytidine1920-2'-O)/16S rRNA (cytidine1409-2'-O)-methyltransferase
VLAQLLRQEIHQQPVLPDALGVAPVTAHDTHLLEPDRLVGADRRLVREGGVDRQPVVVPLVDQPARERAHGVAAEPLAVQGRGQEEVDVRVLELVLARLGELRQANHLALVLDREAGCVIPAFGLVEQVLARDLAPPASDLPLGADLRQSLDVVHCKRPQAHPFTLEVGHDRDHRSVKKRVDVLLVERGLAESRTQAQALLLAGRVPGHEKPGEQVEESAELAVTEGEPYVSRGGAKLANALDAFGVDPAGRDCLDVGASTGGFTDVLLQRGAARVIALDVGYGQLHPRIREDPRVVVLERTNARNVSELPFAPELIVCDVSFISVRKALPPLLELASPGWQAVVLVKPQFEAGREDVRGGVVRDPDTRRRVAREVAEAALAWGAETAGVVDSGLPGPKGNRELFLHLIQRPSPQLPPELDARIADAVG